MSSLYINRSEHSDMEQKVGREKKTNLVIGSITWEAGYIRKQIYLCISFVYLLEHASVSCSRTKIGDGGREAKRLIRQSFVEVSCRNRLSHKTHPVLPRQILGFSVASSLLKVHLNIFSLLTSSQSKYFYGLLDNTSNHWSWHKDKGIIDIVVVSIAITICSLSLLAMIN